MILFIITFLESNITFLEPHERSTCFGSLGDICNVNNYFRLFATHFVNKLYPQDNVEEVILLKYVKDQETNVLSNVDRIRLEMDMFALAFDPVNDRDEGRYLCLINNRPLPDAVIKLNVLGKSMLS